MNQFIKSLLIAIFAASLTACSSMNITSQQAADNASTEASNDQNINSVNWKKVGYWVLGAIAVGAIIHEMDDDSST